MLIFVSISKGFFLFPSPDSACSTKRGHAPQLLCLLFTLLMNRLMTFRSFFSFFSFFLLTAKIFIRPLSEKKSTSLFCHPLYVQDGTDAAVPVVTWMSWWLWTVLNSVAENLLPLTRLLTAVFPFSNLTVLALNTLLTPALCKQLASAITQFIQASY